LQSARWTGVKMIHLGPWLFFGVAGYTCILACEALTRFEVTDEYFRKSYPFGLWATTVRFEDVLGYYRVGGLNLGPFAHKLVVDTPQGRVRVQRFIGPEYHLILEQLRRQVPERESRSSSTLWPW